MEDKETINDYVTRVTRLGNQMKSCGEVVSEQNFVSKVLRSLTPRFDNIVVALEESNDFKTMTKDELQSSLEAHEQRMDERGNDKAKTEVALQSRFNEKNKKSKGKWHSRGKKNFQNFDEKKSQNSRKCEGSSKGGGQGNYKSFDKSTKKCYNCQKLGHFARECRAKPRENHTDEAKVARQDVDYDNTVLVMIMKENYVIKEVLDNNCDKRKLMDNNYCSAEKSAKTHSKKSAMVTVRDGVQGRNEWYLDSGCSTHMTGRKDWFIKINQATRSRVKFADDTTLAADGIGDIELEIMEHRCLATSASRDEWLWHYRLGHLNFRDLDALQKYEMVTGLPSINIPDEICEECIQGNQHKNNFSKDAGSNTRIVSTKMQSEMMLLVGYHPTGGYKLFDVSSKKIVISRDVIVDEIRQFDSRKTAISVREIDLCHENQHPRAAGTVSGEVNQVDDQQGKEDCLKDSVIVNYSEIARSTMRVILFTSL
uniref:Uncharacterized protein LOC101510098 n=1 Tax=Cicer arietinum TaxID=3827 RepID=A0A1S2YT79_CICAR|nr:uncharacterized protein LOC101510098 [Cicer arietinum]